MKNYISIITTYNRKEELEKAIKYLKNQSFLPQKIIVVDNHSSDGTEKLMNEYQNDKIIVYIRLDDNIGGSGGFCVGIKEALRYNPDYIALSDDDAWYKKDYFQKMKKVAEKETNISAFIGVSEDLNTGKRIDQGSLIKDKVTLEGILNVKSDNLCDSASFCGFLFKTNLIKKVGLPRKDFFIWMDDKEYSLRINKVTKILLVKDAIVFHPEQKRTKKGLIPYWKNYYGFRNSILVRNEFSKNKFKANIYNIKELFYHTISIIINNKYKNERKNYLKSYWMGFFDAYMGNLGKNNDFLP